MNSVYCPECGKKNEYALKKPEKCASCNGALFVIPASKIAKKVKAQVEEPEIEVEEQSFVFPSIKRIEIGPTGANWQNIRQPGSTVVGSMAGETPHVRPRDKRINVKKIMEEYRKEATSSHESIKIGD